MMKRGAFILLEGVDRSGKSTQCKRIVNCLKERGIKSKLYCFPSSLWSFKCNSRSIDSHWTAINQYLHSESEVEDHCIHLLFSANRWEMRNEILRDLNDGITIICDRYFASGVAFTAAKGYDLEWCLAPDRGLPAPDIVLFLDLNSEEQKRRGGFGEERYEVSSFQENVRTKFLELIHTMKTINWMIVDANQTMDTVFTQLMDHIERAIEECESKPVSEIFLVYFNITNIMLKLILLLIAFLCIGATEIEEADQQWLQTSEDVMQIAEVGSLLRVAEIPVRN